MTTAMEFRVEVLASGSTGQMRLPVRHTAGSTGQPARSIVPSRTTEDAMAHVRAMRELAALSFDPDSLDRDLEAEINRNAWGISGA